MLEGKYRLAEPLITQTFEKRRRVLGPEHSDTLNTFGNLASLYQRQENYPKAKALQRSFLRSIAIWPGMNRTQRQLQQTWLGQKAMGPKCHECCR